MSNRVRRINGIEDEFKYRVFKVTRKSEIDRDKVDLVGDMCSQGVLIKWEVSIEAIRGGECWVESVVGPLQFDILADSFIYNQDKFLLSGDIEISEHMIRVDQENIHLIKATVVDLFKFTVSMAKMQQIKVFEERYVKIAKGDIVRVPKRVSLFRVMDIYEDGYALLREIDGDYDKRGMLCRLEDCKKTHEDIPNYLE